MIYGLINKTKRTLDVGMLAIRGLYISDNFWLDSIGYKAVMRRSRCLIKCRGELTDYLIT